MTDSGKRSRRPVVAVLTALAAALVFIFLLSLMLGSVRVPMVDVFRACLGQETGSPYSIIVNVFRLPRGLTAMLAGAALALSGLQMQTLFRNPLAGPYVLGISSGASLGVALVILGSGSMGIHWIEMNVVASNGSIAVAGILGASAVCVTVLIVARYIRDNVSLLLVGLMTGYAASAIVSLLVHFSDQEGVRAMVAWGHGSFSGLSMTQVKWLAVIVLGGFIPACAQAGNMNVLLLGNDYAISAGLNVRVSRTALVISTALLAGGATAFCGPVAFLGLAVPHICRGLTGTSDQRVLIPAVLMTGACLALLADIVARLPGSAMTLPLNAVTSLIGAPVVVAILMKRRHLGSLS